MTRASSSPPTRYAIQPKIGVQIGMPLTRARKKVSATAQWIRRVANRWRTTSSPMMTLSLVRATTIGVSTTVLMMSSSLVDAARRNLRAVPGVVNEESEDSSERRDDADRPDDLLPQFHAPWHMRIHRQVVPLGMAMTENRDDPRAVHAIGVVQDPVFESLVLERSDTRVAEGDHLLFLAEL